MKILILKPSSLGDVVQALPVLRLIKKHLPASEVYWWLDAGLVSLLEGDPDLAGVIPFERRRWTSPWHWDEAWASLRTIREHRFDWVIDLQSLLRSAVVAWLANGRFTIGLEDRREGAQGFYDVAVPRPSYDTHAVDWYLAVLKDLGVPFTQDFEWIPERPAVAAVVRETWQLDGARWITLQPGARWSNKRWPVEYFAELVRSLSEQHSAVRFAILGGAADRALGEAVSRARPDRCLDLTGKTSLPEMVEWIRVSELMVTNDTGPMHVATALRKPVVALFGPTAPSRTGPYGQLDQVMRVKLPCAPCMKSVCKYVKPLECLRAISPPMVLSRVQQLLARTKAGNGS